MTREEARSVTPEELDDLQRSGQLVVLIDIRSEEEFREFHAEVARRVSIDSLNDSSLRALRNGSRVTPLYFISGSGMRAKEAARRIALHGITNVAFVEGGTEAWEKAGLAVVRDKKGFSFGGPVRVASGLLSCLGGLLGLAPAAQA